MPYLLYTLLLFAFINCSIAYGQERKSPDRLKEHVKNIELYNRTFPREQVYLHFDNTGYFVGETIRFKAYVMRTDKGQATDLSRVLRKFN